MTSFVLSLIPIIRAPPAVLAKATIVLIIFERDLVFSFKFEIFPFFPREVSFYHSKLHVLNLESNLVDLGSQGLLG